MPGVEARAGKFPGPSLIPALNAIQREHGWLPREELVRLSRETRRPLYEIEGLISFYPHFRTAAPPKVEVTVCHDLTCWLHGADERIAEIRERFGDDVEIEVREVSCIGRCDTAPAVTVNGVPARASEASELVERASSGDVLPLPSATTRNAWPNDPYAEDPELPRYAVVRRLIAGSSAVTSRSKCSRNPGSWAWARCSSMRSERSGAPSCAAWEARGSRRAQSGRRSPSRRAIPST